MKKGLLNKSRVSTSIPNDALYGPEDEGGMKLPHIYLTQGLLHLNKCVMFIASNSITGKLLCTSLELCTLEVGIGRSIFSLDYKNLVIYHLKAGLKIYGNSPLNMESILLTVTHNFSTTIT